MPKNRRAPSRRRKPQPSLRELDRLPLSREPHTWVDYVELLCLVNIDRQMSKADVLDRIGERRDVGEADAFDDVGEAQREPKGDDADAGDGDHADWGLVPVADDTYARKVDDWFRHIEYREATFGAYYPFYLSGDKDVLRRREDLTPEAKLYTYLLLSSNLRYVGQGGQTLTNDFEAVSKEVLRSFLPRDAEVHVFGSNALGPGRYSGNLWTKVTTLAADIGETVHVLQRNFSPYDSGDFGLDLVGWVPSGDSAAGLLIVFGQCACTEEWETKQHSSGPQVWRNVITFQHVPSNVVFIPFCLRDADGTWYKPQRIHSILVDRQRLLYYLQTTPRVLQSRPSLAVVESALAQEESVF